MNKIQNDNMKQHELIALLKFIEDVSSQSWMAVLTIDQDIKIGKGKVISGEWPSDVQKMAPDVSSVEVDKIHSWSALNDPTKINLKFYIEEDSILVEAMIVSKHETINISSIKKHWSKLQFDITWIKKLEELIEVKFMKLAEKRYEEWQKELKIKWIESYKEQLIKEMDM